MSQTNLCFCQSLDIIFGAFEMDGAAAQKAAVDRYHGPLPDDTEDKIGAGGAYFGVRRYQYHGAHSQGNRFISDPDL